MVSLARQMPIPPQPRHARSLLQGGGGGDGRGGGGGEDEYDDDDRDESEVVVDDDASTPSSVVAIPSTPSKQGTETNWIRQTAEESP